MTMPPPAPLSTEERELAHMLDRLDAPRQPSAALDASVLAMARQALTTGASPVASPASRTRQRRWPAAMGLAASLMLAVGITWQLRTPHEQASERAMPNADAASASDAGAGSGPWVDDTADMTVAPPAAEALPAEPMPPSPRPQSITPVSSRDSMRNTASTTARQQERGRSAPPPVHELAADEIAEEALAPPAPIAAPSAPAPPTFEERAAIAGGTGTAAEAAPAQPAARLDQISVSGTRLPSSSAPAKTASQAKPAAQTDTAATARDYDTAGFSTDAIDQEPPAKADTPEVQRAWLQRIRALLARGEITAAQSSLAEFRRRYPGYVLPDDLARLAPPTPADP